MSADYAATWQEGSISITSRHDSASNAWEHLARVRAEHEERHGDTCPDPACMYNHAADLSPGWEALDTLASAAALTPGLVGELTLETPQCDGEDLAPAVFRVQHAPSRASSLAGLASIVAGAELSR